MTLTPKFGDNISSADGWRHIIATATGARQEIHAITLEFSGGPDLTGPATYYIDNIKFTIPTGPPPGPTLNMEHPIRGLNLVSTSGQYQRQNIGTAQNSEYTWVGSAAPVTYSVTVQNYPDASHSGFQTHIFLAPGAVGTDSAPDYTLPQFDLPGHPKPGWRIRHGLLSLQD